jgi:hypothetical protein
MTGEIKLTMVKGCHTGPSGYIGWRAGTTTLWQGPTVLPFWTCLSYSTVVPLDVSVCPTAACAAFGRVGPTVAWAGCLRTCLPYSSLCCLWTCLSYSSLYAAFGGLVCPTSACASFKRICPTSACGAFECVCPTGVRECPSRLWTCLSYSSLCFFLRFRFTAVSFQQPAPVAPTPPGEARPGTAQTVVKRYGEGQQRLL